MIPLLLFAAIAGDLAGTWVYRVDGRNLLVLTFNGNGGTVLQPKSFQMDSEGDVSNVSAELATETLRRTRRPGEFRAGKDRYLFRLVDESHATLAYAEVPWMTIPLERARPSDDLTVPSPWPQPSYSPEIIALRKQLKEMVEADQAPRLPGKMSAEAMEEIDRKHRPEIERIFERYGWPKRTLVGKDAAHDFWLLVQHQPPGFQERLLPEMERAMQQGEASRSDYAYLYDRVRTGQGKPQRWGTQVKCVNGLPVLSPVEDAAALDERRRELRMPPIRDYLKAMKPLCGR